MHDTSVLYRVMDKFSDGLATANDEIWWVPFAQCVDAFFLLGTNSICFLSEDRNKKIDNALLQLFYSYDETL